MIFKRETLAFEFIEAFEIDQSNVRLFNDGRNFDALSFRICSDTDVETTAQKIHLGSNTVSYFPSNVAYMRSSRYDRIIVIHFKCFDYRSDRIEYFTPCEPQKYRAQFERILETFHKKEKGYKHGCSAILSMIFAECYRDNSVDKPINPMISRAVEYINENMFLSEMSLDKAIKLSNISDVYFRKLFKKEFNISPKKYIIKQRVNYAAALINTGYYSLGEVASMSGFSDYKYFSVEFKRVTGVSPSKYHYNFGEMSRNIEKFSVKEKNP